MKQVTDLITISELSRLIDISRPTLYKYIKDYENNDFTNLNYNIVVLFNFITSDSTCEKSQIVEYCMLHFKNENDQGVFDKIKNLMRCNRDFKDLVQFMCTNYEKIDFMKLKNKLQESMEENHHGE